MVDTDPDWPERKVLAIPITLTATQKDILMMLLDKKEVMTVKAIERTIDYAYIFKALDESYDQIILESSLVEDGDIKEAIKNGKEENFLPPVLEKEFDRLFNLFLCTEYLDQKADQKLIDKSTELENRIKEILSNEEHRYKLVSEINKGLHYSIPNYRKVESELKMLKSRNITVDYIYRENKPPKVMWGLDPLFYQAWLKTHTIFSFKEDSKTARKKAEEELIKEIGSETVDYYLLDIKEATLSEYVSVYSEEKTKLEFYLGI